MSIEEHRGHVTRFEHLVVWQKAHSLVLDIYKVTARLPDHEKYGLRSQMCRSAVSVPANIAEGFKRFGFNDKTRFYNIAQSSLEELRYYCILCRDLGYEIDESLLQQKTAEVGRMLTSLIKSTGKKK